MHIMHIKLSLSFLLSSFVITAIIVIIIIVVIIVMIINIIIISLSSSSLLMLSLKRYANNVSIFCYLFPLDKLRSSPIVQLIDNATAMVGDSFTVKCEAYGKTEPQFKLYKNIRRNGTRHRVLVDRNVKHRIKLGDPHSGKHRWYIAFWTLKNLSLDDQMFYTCEARNFIGVKNMSFFLMVVPKGE